MENKEKISEKVKVVNLFRLAKRLETNESPKDLYSSFEKSLFDCWELLNSSEKRILEELHLNLKKKYLNRVSAEKEQLFGVIHK